MSVFADLRRFAIHIIPRLLRDAGGAMDKQKMHGEVERLFIGNQQWPDELLRTGKRGCLAKTNAIAWAMSDLVVEKVLERSMGSQTVRLR